MMAENLLSSARLLCAIMFILPPTEGAIKFTLKPPNPSYARNGSNAKLVWDYSVDNQAELNGIIYSVQVPGAASFTNMLGLQNDGTVITFSSIPNEYKGRVRIEGRASLVIENITSQDNSARFMCTLVAKAGAGRDIVRVVQLIVTGKSNALCPTDVAFILDSSNSIKDEDFNDEKEIVKKLVMNLDIAPDKNRAALVRFSTSPLLVARFGEYETAYKFQDVLEKLTKMGKRTRIDRALKLAENQIFPEARKGVNKMTIILTDGVQSTGAQGLRPSSKPLRDAGVRVIAVGVGVGKRERRLRLMTDRDEDVVDLKDVQRRLQEILDDISQNGCSHLGSLGSLVSI